MVGIRYQYAVENTHEHSTGNGYFGVDKLCSRLADAGLLLVDLRNRVSLSERGHAFAEWLVASDYRAHYFWSDVGTWGERPTGMREHEHIRNAPRNVFDLHVQATQQTRAANAQNEPPAPSQT